MHVLVPGAFGKAAFSIVEALKEGGHEIRGFDLPDAACPDRTRGILKDIILGRVENLGGFVTVYTNTYLRVR